MSSQLDYSAEEALKRFESLPNEIKSILYSPEMLVTVRKIGETNKLHLDQIGILQTEVSAVLLGFIETSDLSHVLEENLGVNAEQAHNIVLDLNNQLFIKIRDAMQAVYEQQTAKLPTTIHNPPAMSSPPPLATQIPLNSNASAQVATPPVVAPTITSTPVSTPAAPTTPAPTPASPAPVNPAPATPMHPADVMLSEPTVSMAKPAPAATPMTPTSPAVPTTPLTPTVPKPGSYKTDPYREPPE